MSDMEAIAQTLANDFTATVKAAKRAQVAAIDGILSSIEDAQQARTGSYAEARRLQEDAARMAAESIRISEKADDKFWQDMQEAKAALNELRGPAVTSRPKVRAITGGKQAEG